MVYILIIILLTVGCLIGVFYRVLKKIQALQELKKIKWKDGNI